MSAAPENDDGDCLTLTVDTHTADLLKWLEKISTAGHFCQSASDDGTLAPTVQCHPFALEPFVCTDLEISIGTVCDDIYGRYVLFLQSRAARAIIYKMEGASFFLGDEIRPVEEGINDRVRVDDHFAGILQEARDNPRSMVFEEALKKFQDPNLPLFFADNVLECRHQIPLPALMIPLSAGHTIKSAVKA
jgi:hypothetical protein